MISKTLNTDFNDIDDKNLWLDFLNGDKKAFENIYCRFVQHLFNYGMKLNPNRSLVKDCIQELFVELWNRRHHLAATDNIKYYLLKALKFKMNHVLDHEVKVQKKLNFVKLFSNVSEKSHEDRIVESQQWDEQVLKLYKAMEKLPEKQREIINLVFFEDLSYDQVSELMSINVSSSYTLVWKATRALKKIMKEMYVVVVAIL